MNESRLWRRILRPLILLFVIGAVFWVGHRIRSYLGIEFSVESIQAWIDEWGRIAAIIYFLLVVFRLVIGIPSAVLIISGGLCLGAVWATLLGGGILVSAMLMFAAGRGIGGEWIQRRLGEKTPELEERIRNGGPFIIGLASAHPAVIMTPFHCAAGFSSIRFVPFCCAVGVGATIRAFVLAFFGSTLTQVGSFTFFGAMATFAAIAVVPMLFPRFRRRIFGE